MAEAHPPTLDGGILLTFLFSIGIAGWVFILFFLFRRKFPDVYFPIERDNKAQYTLLQWILPTLSYTNEEILPRSGLIGALYLEWKYYCCVFLCLVCCTTIPLLIYLYYTHSPSDQIYFAGMAASALLPEDNIHWVTFGVSVVVSLGVLILLLRYKYYYFTQRRSYIKRLSGDIRVVDIFASRVYGIDKSLTDEGQILEKMALYNEILSTANVRKITIAWDYNKLLDLQLERRKIERQLANIEYMRKNDPKYHDSIRLSRFGLPGWMTCNRKVDRRHYYQDRLNYLVEKIQKCQVKLENKPKKYHSQTVFLLFDSIQDNVEFKRNFKSPKKPYLPFLNQWKVHNCKNPRDILWHNLHYSQYRAVIPMIISCIIMVVLAFIIAIPIAFLSQLSNVALIPGIGIGIYHVLVLSPWLQSFLESLLPSLLTMIVFSMIPPFAVFLSKFEYHHSRSSLNASAMVKMWIFYILNGFVFLILLMGGIDITQSLKNIFDSESPTDAFFTLNYSLYGAFYCNYFIAEMFVGGATKISCFGSLVERIHLRWKWRKFPLIREKKLYRLVEFDYFDMLAQEAFYITIFILFAPIVPLVSACAFVFFCANYMNDKISIALISAHEYGYEKMLNRFFGFLLVGLFFVFIFWEFFFTVRHRVIGILGAVFYGIILILYLLIFLFFDPVFKFFTKNVEFTNMKTLAYMEQNSDQYYIDEEETPHSCFTTASSPYLFPGTEKLR